MTSQIRKHESQPDDQIRLLENEIAAMESELQGVETKLNAFEAQIRAKLHIQIRLIRELTDLYKTQKKAKKESRKEQKKKGKKYKEPVGITKRSQSKSQEIGHNIHAQKELKRLYKEAIVHVHPDKYVSEDDGKKERANDVTVQLINIYKSGNLDELIDFHEHIVSGNAMSHMPYQPETIVDSKAMLSFLQKKKEELELNLEETKKSYTYSVLTTYADPLTFIDELSLQFDERINQLKKRTRKR